MSRRQQKIGIALGGGGARGLAHIPLLKALDENGYRVSAISGTSIGAIIGALYATGMSGAAVRSAIDAILATPESLKEAFSAKRKLGWIDLLDLDVGRSSLLDASDFLTELQKHIGVLTFEELAIPLKIVATDYWAQEAVMFDSGSLLPAIHASSCIPGIFKPVMLDGKVLVDGGSVNPIPFDLIRDECDILIAVDILNKPSEDQGQIPSLGSAVFQTFQIAERAIAREKLRHSQPDIYLEIEISGVGLLDFHKADKIYKQTERYTNLLLQQLQTQIS